MFYAPGLGSLIVKLKGSWATKGRGNGAKASLQGLSSTYRYSFYAQIKMGGSE